MLRGIGLLRLPADLIFEGFLVLLGGQSPEVITNDYKYDWFKSHHHFFVGEGLEPTYQCCSVQKYKSQGQHYHNPTLQCVSHLRCHLILLDSFRRRSENLMRVLEFTSIEQNLAISLVRRY